MYFIIMLLFSGEAVMFGEHVDANNIQSVIYPRAAAVGERLWSQDFITGDRCLFIYNFMMLSNN